MVFIEILVEGKIPVKALIDTSSKFNTISKSLFDKIMGYKVYPIMVRQRQQKSVF